MMLLVKDFKWVEGLAFAQWPRTTAFQMLRKVCDLTFHLHVVQRYQTVRMKSKLLVSEQRSVGETVCVLQGSFCRAEVRSHGVFGCRRRSHWPWAFADWGLDGGRYGDQVLASTCC